MNENVFNIPIDTTPKKVAYYMGIDNYDEDNNAYCLVRNTDGVIDIIFCKTIKDKKEFKKEIKNLAKYFNAVTTKEFNKTIK